MHHVQAMEYVTSHAESVHVVNSHVGLTTSPADVIVSLREENGDADALLVASQLEITRLVVQRIIVPLVVACGVTGNVLTMIVMTRAHMRSSTNNYLTALALYDSLYLLATAAMSLKHYSSVKDQAVYIRLAFPWVKPLVDTFSNTTVWLTVTFTAERLIAVSCPLRAQVSDLHLRIFYTFYQSG
jgi:hypothetical protein